MATLTAANSILMLVIPGLYASPQRLQGYATDDAFDVDAVEPAQTQMGVDGIMSAGYTPVEKKLNITLQADSPSLIIFDTWVAAQDTAREVLPCFANMSLPAVLRKWSMNKGILTSHTPIPGVKKILQPRKYTITFESMSPAAL